MSRFWGMRARRISPTDPQQTPLHTDIGYKGFGIGEPLQSKWFNLEPTHGAWALSNLGTMIDTIQNAGLHCIVDFGGPPDWARIDQSSENPPVAAHYLAMVDRVSQEFAGQGLSYELWNEADYSFFWPGTVEQAVETFAPAAAIIKGNDPTARVIAPSVTSAGATWLEEFLDGGGLGACDAIAYHAYVYPGQPEVMLANAQPFIALKYQYGKPLLNTEFTWNSFRIDGAGETISYPTLMSEDMGAAYLARSFFILGNLKIDENYFFGLDEWISTNAGFSVIETLDTDDLSVKLGPALAVKYQIGLLGSGGRLTGFYRIPPMFRQDFVTNQGVPGQALWCGDGQTRATDITGWDHGTDMYGDAITLAADYSVTSEPIYLFAS